MKNDDKQSIPNIVTPPASSAVPPIIFAEDSVPPMLSQNTTDINTQTPIVEEKPVESAGSAAPANDIVIDTIMPAVVTSGTPKKKFAGGKVIATILGLFLLVGGVGAGVYLTGQNQNIQEKASYDLDQRCAILKACGEGCRQEYASDCGGTEEEVITAVCQDVKAYSTNNWTLLTPAILSTLRAGDSVNFCVTGSATGGSFDKARFTINGAQQAETTATRPGSSDFCQTYNIPAGVTTFNVVADINHVTLGWR